MTRAQLQLIEGIFDAASKLEPQEIHAYLE
jgi:hypothetical protein